MELLLNIIWLALALPAVWIWYHKPAYAPNSQGFERYLPFLLLGCALILLFPVVSATDDLNAMRPEIEESNPSTRQLKHSGGIRSSIWTHTSGNVLFHPVGVPARPDDEPCALVCVASAGLPELIPLRQNVSRGPPAGIPS